MELYYGNILWHYISIDHAYLLKLFKKYLKQQFNDSVIQPSTIISSCLPIKSKLLLNSKYTLELLTYFWAKNKIKKYLRYI